MAKQAAQKIGWGIQPAQLQIHPPVREASSQIKPPPVPLSVSARLYRVEDRVGLLEELRIARARIQELEDEIERSRPPF